MMRSGADEAAAPKYSHVERERRFLVDPAKLPLLPLDHILIEDRYIIGTRFRVRRMTDSASDAVALKLAKKYEADDPTARPMVNAYLSEGEYAVFADLPGHAISKRRYLVAVGSDVFGVDVFKGELKGLVLAEIDADDAARLRVIAKPAWALREVTDDPRFQGGNLATLDVADAAGLIARR